jgi:two-component system response regulator AtoC
MTYDRSVKERVLVIEDDPVVRANLLELLEEEGFDAVPAANGADGIALAKARAPNLVVCDIGLPLVDGFGVLRAVREDSELASTPFIFLSARAERQDVRAGMTSGADDYLTKPFTSRELLDAVRMRMRRVTDLVERGRRAVERGSARTEIATATASPIAEGIVVDDPAMRELYQQATQAAAAPISVLILGETGVGKEVLARTIHRLSRRASGPFVALNCAALTESLLQAELFGHEKGAFTGALQARAGLFEAADGGTLFLDEIGELSQSVQTQLLRVLEERKVLRVGGRAERAVDVRIVAATHRDVEAESERGTFRADLFYRLNGVSFTVPPLRQRRAEIPALCAIFLSRISAQLERNPPLSLSPDTLALLERYSWPGNIRELKNVIERGAVLCCGDVILPEHLSERVHARASSAPAPVAGPRRDSLNALDEAARDSNARARQAQDALEKERVSAALEQCAGNQTRAAEVLGISRRTLVSRLKTLDLPRPRDR